MSVLSVMSVCLLVVTELLYTLSGHFKVSSKAGSAFLATVSLVFSIGSESSPILDYVVAGAITADQRITSF